jgi:hypothetical protein
VPEPVVYKASIVFEQHARGWTESYYLQSPALNYETAIARLDEVAKARAKLLGREAFIKGFRVSRVDEKNEGYIEYTRYNGNADKDSAQPDVAILVTCYDALFSRKKNIYLRGVWDEWEEKGGILTREDKLFTKAFAEFTNALTRNNAPFGWWGVTGKTQANVTNIVADADDRLTMTFDADVFAEPLFGTKQKIRLTGVNGRSGMNGEHIVQALTARTCVTVVSTRHVAYKFGGRVAFNTYGFLQMKNLTVAKVTSRDSGAPLLESRGRQRATPRN